MYQQQLAQDEETKQDRALTETEEVSSDEENAASWAKPSNRRQTRRLSREIEEIEKLIYQNEDQLENITNEDESFHQKGEMSSKMKIKI